MTAPEQPTSRVDAAAVGLDLDLEVGPVLHHGAHAQVVLARHRRTGRTVVVKRALDAPGAAALHAAAAVLQAADHPGVVAVLDRGDGVLVLPHLTGGSLTDLLGSCGPLAERATAVLVLEVADALTHLHDLGLAHGDLSGSNVLLRSDGSPVLIDPCGPAPPTPTGTAGYVAPEVAHATPVGPLADVHALAVLGLECLGPVGGDDLRTVLRRAGAPDAAERTPSARRLAADVAAAVPGATWLDRCRPPPVVRPPTPDEATTRPAPTSALAAPTTRAFGPGPPRPAPRRPAPARSVRPGLVVALTIVLAVLLLVAAERVGASPSQTGGHQPAASSTGGGPHHARPLGEGGH